MARFDESITTKADKFSVQKVYDHLDDNFWPKNKQEQFKIEYLAQNNDNVMSI